MPRKSQFTDEQIIRAIREVDAGEKAATVCRKLGVTEKTFYRWRSKFGGMARAKRSACELSRKRMRRSSLGGLGGAGGAGECRLVTETCDDTHLCCEVPGNWGCYEGYCVDHITLP